MKEPSNAKNSSKPGLRICQGWAAHTFQSVGNSQSTVYVLPDNSRFQLQVSWELNRAKLSLSMRQVTLQLGIVLLETPVKLKLI